MLCIFMHALFNAAHATVYIHNNTLTQFTIENWTSADNGNGFKVLVKRKEISNLLYKIFIFSFRFRVSKKKKKQSRHLIQNPKFSLTHALCSKLKPWSNVASNNRLDDFRNALLHKIPFHQHIRKKNIYANTNLPAFSTKNSFIRIYSHGTYTVHCSVGNSKLFTILFLKLFEKLRFFHSLRINDLAFFKRTSSIRLSRTLNIDTKTNQLMKISSKLRKNRTRRLNLHHTKKTVYCGNVWILGRQCKFSN